MKVLLNGFHLNAHTLGGVSNGPIQFESGRSNYSQKLDVCSLAHAHKSFASAGMLRFSLQFPVM